MVPTDAERIAKLEAKQQESERVHTDIARRLDKHEAALEQIRTDVGEIKLKLSGWRGFLGGAMFVLTSIGGLIGAAIMSLWHALTSNGH